MDIGTNQFIGFLAKKVAGPQDWLPEHVHEICSVCQCFSAAHEDWITHWVHNDAGLYETEDLAWQVTPVSERAKYVLFGYRCYPIEFADGRSDRWEPSARWPNLPQERQLDGYDLLGFDLVGLGVSSFFECSPLSCNGMSAEIPTNEHCLIDDVQVAVSTGLLFSRPDSGVEPATYHLVEVWRQRVEESITPGAPVDRAGR